MLPSVLDNTSFIGGWVDIACMSFSIKIFQHFNYDYMVFSLASYDYVSILIDSIILAA